jgi:hypothetical protein
MIVANYTAEQDAPNDYGDVDIADIFDVRNPELQGVCGLRTKNDFDNYNRVNPITILVPHIDLEIGTYCAFTNIA